MKPKNKQLNTAQTVAAVCVWARLKGTLARMTGRNSDRIAATETARRNGWRWRTAEERPEKGLVEGLRRMEDSGR